MAEKPGTRLEIFVQKILGAKPTSNSGATWGDGDSTLILDNGKLDLSIEVKDVKAAALDKWWSQARRQAMRLGKTPVLVVRRPPAKLDHGVAVTDELIAIIPLHLLEDLVEGYNKE